MEGRGSEEVNMETSTHKGVCVQVEEQEGQRWVRSRWM